MKKELPDLLTAVSQLYEKSGEQAADESTGSGSGGENGGEDGGGNGKGKVIGTTKSIAGKLDCKTGPDLIVAAAAHLTFVGGKNEFSRKELLGHVQGASGYYNENMGKNFTLNLNSLVKASMLVEPKSGHYALIAAKKTELRSKLAS